MSIHGSVEIPPPEGRRAGEGLEKGQALVETMLIMPFFILLMMILAEFGIYFYRMNMLENTAQQIGRMAARGAAYEDLETYMNANLASFKKTTPPSPTLKVLDDVGDEVTTWESDDALEIRLGATVSTVMPIDALNVFAAGKTFFPDQFALECRKKVYVE